MRLGEFAEQRNVKLGTVSAYIKNHSEFDKLVHKDGRNLILSDEALLLLDKKYPIPKPIEIVEDVELIKELSETRLALAKVQKELSDFQNRYIELQEKYTVASASQLLLEDRDKQIDELKSKLEEEQNKSWLAKLFGK